MGSETAPTPLTAEWFAERFIRIRGAHNPTADELDGEQEVRPCAWCRLAGEQAAEAADAARREQAGLARLIVSYADLTHEVVVQGRGWREIADEWGKVVDAVRAALDSTPESGT